MKTIKETTNGRVFMCNKCDAIHIEYKNLNFNLSAKQYKDYSAYIINLNGQEWERINKDSGFTRKIIIPTQDTSFNMMLTNTELTELKTLFGCDISTDRNIVKYQNLLKNTCLN